MHETMALVCGALFAWATVGCATQAPAPEVQRVVVEPDDVRSPRSVRFEVPTSMLMGLPGQYRLPVTGQARLATRAVAADELAARGWCVLGFDGPAGIHFSADRTRAVFVVHCRR